MAGLRRAELSGGGHMWVDENGQLHHPTEACHVEANGDAVWAYHGEIHRHPAEGPAIIKSRTRAYFWHGKRHRLEGPAREDDYTGPQWFIDGHLVRPGDFADAVEKYCDENPTCPTAMRFRRHQLPAGRHTKAARVS